MCVGISAKVIQMKGDVAIVDWCMLEQRLPRLPMMMKMNQRI